ncbi:DUF5602 domain-containing protein [Antrihabitans cavernicola]|uniref:TTHB210-like domain-containing protein n=1 Tax=Antrihabitans cavernicola TaxID=2495913 RepID=A0A5A7SHV0_9NOCA|nr:DUF5602 domain-containing protein [Spelaeibacter cavernicola]KAA0024939.1 hypothetical protein FOY51_03190 [Spelaeibacter cavernicola]
MSTVRFTRGAALALAAATTVFLLPACSSDAEPDKAGTFYGPSQTLGHGTVRTYATVDGDGNPTAVGVRMSETALDGLPTEDAVPPAMSMIDFPDQAAQTPFDSVMLNWNSHGHDPAPLFGKPHFDVHFDMVDMAAMDAISPADPQFAARAERLPDPKYTPQDYVTPPGPPIAQQAVPGMGVHMLDGSAMPIPGQYNFEQIFINGSWNGTYTFMEPMITREWLLTKPTLQQQIKQPQAYQKTGYYPTTYSVHFDDAAKEYDIQLGSLTHREQS